MELADARNLIGQILETEHQVQRLLLAQRRRAADPHNLHPLAPEVSTKCTELLLYDAGDGWHLGRTLWDLPIGCIDVERCLVNFDSDAKLTHLDGAVADGERMTMVELSSQAARWLKSHERR